MKILFVAPRFHTNQVEWIRALNLHGHEVAFHALLRGATENYTVIKPIVLSPCLISRCLMSIFGEGGVNLVRGFPEPFSYFRYLSEQKYDIIVVRDIGRWFSFLAATCGRFLGSRIIIYSQTPLYKNYSSFRRLITWLTLKIFSAVWMTPILGDKKANIKPPSNMFYVPFAVPIYVRREINTQPPFRILEIGKFEPRKNHRLLLQALKQLQAEGYEFLLSIIGECSQIHHYTEHSLVMEEILKLELSERVTVLVNIRHEEISTFYANADLFILPATDEPASISILEALGHGLPVICSETSGTRCYILNGKTGFTFADNSLDDLVRVLRKTLNVKMLQQMRRQCEETCIDKISSEAFISTFFSMIGNSSVVI